MATATDEGEAAADLVFEGTRRRRAMQLALVALAIQLLVPLGYYTIREDRYDERFAWRMFSAVRLHQCDTEAVDVREGGEVGDPLELRRLIHVGWVSLLARNRRDVVAAFLERRCEEPGVVEAQLRNVCRSAAGERLPLQVYERTCASGEERFPDAPLGEAPRGDGP